MGAQSRSVLIVAPLSPTPSVCTCSALFKSMCCSSYSTGRAAPALSPSQTSRYHSRLLQGHAHNMLSSRTREDCPCRCPVVRIHSSNAAFCRALDMRSLQADEAVPDGCSATCFAACKEHSVVLSSPCRTACVEAAADTFQTQEASRHAMSAARQRG